MGKIEKLTADQEQALVAYHAECMAIGTSTAPADRPRAEAAISKMYQFIGKPQPKFIWCDSPATCILARLVLQEWLKTAKDESSLWSSLESSLGSSLRSSWWGQQEQYWIGFYRFMELHLKITYDPQKSEHLGWWQDITESANWWFPYEGYCFVSERPIRCAIDEERRLHHESLAAMEFKDGWKVYAYHGVTVSAQVIETPETITIEQIKKEENAEVRRCMVERMGWERFYVEAGMKVLHEDTLESNFPSIPVSELVSESARLVTSYRPGTETAQLLEAEGIKDYEDRPLRFVRLTDPSTGRQYTLRVLHSHTRCYEAIAWTFGKTEEQYRNGKYARHGDVGLFPLSGGPTAQTHS